MGFVKKISAKARNSINYIPYRYKQRHSETAGDTQKHEKSVLFLGAYNIPGRRIAQIIHYFLFSGYKIYLDYSFRQYLNLNVHAIYASRLDGVYPIGKRANNFAIIISDNKGALDDSDQNSLKIYIKYLSMENRFNIIADVTMNDLYYPIGLHPDFLRSTIEHKILDQASKSERKIMAIFAGNTNTVSKVNPEKNGYNMEITKVSFQINTRFEMFSYIAETLPKDFLFIPDDLKTFLQAMESGALKSKIVLINTHIFSIPHDKYFDVLLNSNFFIHMSGYIQPFCHNQIESMLAGCIPISQFERFFVPRFKHELNGLLFNSLDELISLLLNISSGKYEPSIRSMRREIIKYYRNYYSFDSFGNKLSYLMNNNIEYTSHYILGN